MKTVKAQYETHPYPPIPVFALPGRKQGINLVHPDFSKFFKNKKLKILIAGCGSFEPTLVAQTFPSAQKILAVDLSRASLRRAKLRAHWARMTRPLGPIEFIEGDLTQWSAPEQTFDFILASNVLHHVENPELLLARLTRQLKPGGLMRVVTYPKASRIWMRRTSDFFRTNGLSAHSRSIKAKARQLIATLPQEDPRRLTFTQHQEVRTTTGIVDAFLHACENPLSPLQWGHACQRLGLELITEEQDPGSQSKFLEELLPETQTLSPWIKLEILDRLLELCANPILWLRKLEAPFNAELPEYESMPSGFTLEAELKNHLHAASHLLAPVGVSIQKTFECFKKEVGPRVSPTDADTILPGLALTDYDFEKLKP